MPGATPSFTLGLEEEYLLVDKESRDLVAEPPAALFEKCHALLEERVSPEFMRTQVEVNTAVCHSIAEARDELGRLRKTVAQVAAEFGLAPIAASTHPFARWQKQKHTDRERYKQLHHKLQIVAERMLVSGMHVHVGIEQDELRIDTLNQVAYFLPHLLALSTSSPFWEGAPTGLMSYRLCVFDELPRTGLPERFTSYGEYQRTIALMVEAGLIEDASRIWWDVRLSNRFPTLEMRITDICTLLDDAMCCAALYLCLCRMLYRLRRDNQRWRSYPALLINENRWRAQRYGTDEGLVDFGSGQTLPWNKLVSEFTRLLRADAEHFHCTEELEHARTILQRGTSAHRQLRTYHEAKQSGATDHEALIAVVDQLIQETTSF